jgi:predicted site-specific integrase-resolvase
VSKVAVAPLGYPTSKAATRLGVSPTTMRRLINAGVIRARVTPSGRVSVDADAIEAYRAAMPVYQPGTLPPVARKTGGAA